jgi:ribosomal-protein-alanine N-acetyltransferase
MTGSDLQLRAAGPFDHEILAALQREAFPEEPWDTAAIAAVLGMAGAFGCLATESDAGGGRVPVGYYLGLALVPECELVSLAVRPSAWRRGIGTALMRHFLAAAAAAGASEVFLEVASDNARGQRLYAALEFESVGVRPDYYRRSCNTRVAAQLLRRRLVQ